MFMIYFWRHFMKYKNSENRFSEFSLSWKTLLLNLFPCLINPFVINGFYKSKWKRKHYVKSKQSGFRILYYKIWRILKIDWSSFFKTMNENDFNYFDAITRFKAYQAQRRYRKLFLFFSFLKKITEIWQKPLETAL